MDGAAAQRAGQVRLGTASRGGSSPHAAANGARANLARAYNDHGLAVWRLADQLCGPAAAVEVTADAFLALRSLPESPGSAAASSVRAWLLASAHRYAVASMRADTCRSARLSHMSVVEIEQEALARAGSKARSLLSELPAAERRVIALAYYGGHTCGEIAGLVDQTNAAVRGHIRAGLAHLQKLGEPGGPKNRLPVDPPPQN
jgi:RNA polymerase sigma-70 factor (ECF subfamily)